jgi:hypothetical protein
MTRLDDLDPHSMQNIVRFLVRDPRDVGALRLSCKYIAAAIPADITFIQPVNAITTIIKTLYDPQCTDAQVYNLVRDYPYAFKDSELIGKLIIFLSPTRMRIISDCNVTRIFGFDYYLYQRKMFFKFIQSHCDETVAIDIIKVSQRYNLIDCNKIVQILDEARDIYARLTAVDATSKTPAKSNSAKNRIIRSLNQKNTIVMQCVYPYESVYTFLYNMFCPDIIFEPLMRDVCDIYSVVYSCTDAARMIHIIEVYGNQALHIMMLSYSARSDDITFWRDLRRIAFARADDDALFNKNIFIQICAQYVNYIIDMINDHNDADYHAFWRDVFMCDNAIQQIDKKNITYTFLHICNARDIDELIAANLLSMTDFNVFSQTIYNIDMYATLIVRNVINATNCKQLFLRIINNYHNMIIIGINVNSIVRLFIDTFPNKLNRVAYKILLNGHMLTKEMTSLCATLSLATKNR